MAIMLIDESDNESVLFLDKMEDITANLLAEIFENATKTDGSVHILALELTTANLTDLGSRLDQTDGFIVVRVDGIIGIQDGIFNETSIIDVFIPSTIFFCISVPGHSWESSSKFIGSCTEVSCCG